MLRIKGQTLLICCFLDLSQTNFRGLRIIIKRKRKAGRQLHENAKFVEIFVYFVFPGFFVAVLFFFEWWM